MDSKFDSFSDLLRGALGGRLNHASDLTGMFAEDVVFEFPYAPDGFPRRLEGLPALAVHLERLGPMLELGRFTLRSIYPSAETVTLEFSCDGRGIATGLPYDQDYISVVTLREGRIARYRDYWNPLVALSALGGAEAAAAGYAGQNTDG